ncbi:2-phosphosulfolactate phosphatase [Actinopolymorpha sp. B17G11]|uniref:2-phosphosulfolactate phosphatase n=1 Tax=Actinopolymorpha sp. B17G11 TaxID=3160861 RepID=UPI0032E3D5FA
MSAAPWYAQSPYGIRFEWGPAGAERIRQGCACVVVVDVLSFTTAVTVVVEAGTRVFPYAWRDETAATFAKDKGARLAVGRKAVSEESPWSLSPAALRRAPTADRLVLPSPNGSSISAAAASAGATVVAGSLRNARATGRWLSANGFGSPERPVAVIASGERWSDGSLRPALEDLLGAGAVIAALADAGREGLSPEAFNAHASFRTTADVTSAVADCASGRELIAYGFAEDVAVATEVDGSGTVPVLTDEGFVAAT